MANVYRNFATSIHAFEQQQTPNPLLDYPSIQDGIRGMKFIEIVIASGNNNSQWMKL
jgi:hypothetical protein